jgi:hypothetical protein
MCGYTLQDSGGARFRDQTPDRSNGLLHARSCAIGNLVTISHGSYHHASEPFYQELSDRSQFSHKYNMTVCSRRNKEYFGSRKVAGSCQTIINPVSMERVIIIIPYGICYRI